MAPATIVSEKDAQAPHVALFPSAGMGHLMPCLQLASMLSSRGCIVTLITAVPTVSDAESDHLATFSTMHPNIRQLEFHILPHKKSEFTNEDPFFIQFEAIEKSIHLLGPLLSSLSPPLDAVIADFPFCDAFTRLDDLSASSVSLYTMIPTSARLLSVFTHFPELGKTISRSSSHIDVPGLGEVPVSILPPPLLIPSTYFAANVTTNASALSKVKGIIVNSFDFFEPEAIQALKTRGATSVFPVGPLEPLDMTQGQSSCRIVQWLDEQPLESVVFVSFGNRTALSKDQIKELSCGLEMVISSVECKFLWVLKGSKVDREDKEGVEELVGKSFLEKTKEKGVVIKEWVDQDKILAHPAVGGYVTHSGWNSVVESARIGVPLLVWPQGGDHKVNAEVAARAGTAIWVREWDWNGGKLVGRNEIAENIKELMQSKSLRTRVMEVKNEAHKARQSDGSSERSLRGLIQAFKNKKAEKD